MKKEEVNQYSAMPLDDSVVNGDRRTETGS
jgi:hypothetical protein